MDRIFSKFFSHVTLVDATIQRKEVPDTAPNVFRPFQSQMASCVQSQPEPEGQETFHQGRRAAL